MEYEYFLFFLFFLLIRKIAYKNIVLIVLFNIPSTILHETAHYFFALLSHAQPKSFSIIPQRKHGYIQLGSVVCTNLTWYNALLVGFAPLVFLPVIYLFFVKMDSNSFFDYFFNGYILFTLFFTSLPSVQDIRVATSSILGVGFYSVMIGIFYRLQTML